ncbi:hypothetical protein H0H81_006934 [Sphagnurus paluster]|uniref:VIT domain-containing protein n=1 Tax=Sphagnurus paluster TaxID=117069 RepID=A0A9P7GLC4_9AGAR|nr:hypothetical protein H0H81_006934 [Sphagnurus paluster]
MKTSDGRTVTGFVKEKKAAQLEYEEAVRSRQFAGLVNHATDDIFTISIGAIPPHATVEVHLETKFVDSIKEGGGTEIGLALRSVLSSRDKQMPTVAYGDDPILVVGEAVKESSTNAPLRVFTLGIGHGISTATCDGIARAGNGASLYALDTEGILGQCARLFTAGRSSFVRDVKIDWGIPRDELGVQGVSFSNQTLSAGSIPNLPPPVIQQAPTEITHIHAGTRMNIYVIISLKRGFVPKKIVLSGENESSGGSFELSIPVHLVRLTGADEGLPLIHTLAAAWLIKEHQARKAPLPIAVMPASEDDIRRAVIVRIAEKYQLVSEHTSFVAVDSGQDDPRRSRHRTRRTILRSRSHSPEVRGRNIIVTPTGLFQSTLSVLSGLFGIGSNTIRDDSQTLTGSWPDSPPRSATPSDDGVDEDEEGRESEDSRETFSTLSSLESYGWSDWSRTPSPIPRWSEEDERMRNQPSPNIECNLGLPDLPLAPVGASAVPPREVVELMRLQCFDGSFKLEELRGIIGSKALDEVNNVDVDAKVWATALSVAFMRKHMGNQKEMLSDLLAKALDYLGAMAQGLVDELIAHAEHALA